MSMAKCRAPVLLAAAAVLLTAVHAAAQAEPARRVRVRTAGERPIMGTLQAMNETAITVKPDGAAGLVTLDRARITRIEVSRGGTRRSTGAANGLVAGGLVGAFLGLLVPNDYCPACFRSYNFRPTPQWKLVVVTAGILGALGAGIGAMVPPGEKWEAVSLDRLHVSVAPDAGRGVRMVVSFGF
jgi:hypothetical protein